MEFESLLRCLHTIGSVPPGARLGHNLDNSLFVAGSGFISNAWRVLLGEGRVKSCSTITTVLAAANERLQDAENNRHGDGASSPEKKDLENRVCQLLDGLRDASKGVEALQVTYATDCAAVAHLQVLHRKASLLISRADSLARSLSDHIGKYGFA